MNINQLLLAAAMGEIMPLDFAVLPLTEAEADANHFVVEFNGGSNANETGVGGGLSGANLDLTRFGTVAAASGGSRAVSANGGFNATDTLFDTFMRNASGYSFLWQMSNYSSGSYLAFMQGTPASWITDIETGGVFFNMPAKYGGGLLASGAIAVGDVFPASGKFWVLMSVDYTNDLCFIGISHSVNQPEKLLDFELWTVLLNPQTIPASAVSAATSRALVGYGTTGAAFNIHSFTAKKGASVTLA